MDPVQAGVGNFKAVIESAKESSCDAAKTAALDALTQCPVPTADEAIREGYKEMAKPKPKPASKPRATAKAGKRPATPDPIEPMKEKAQHHFQTHGYTPEETKAAGLLRRRLRRWFEKFEHRLRPYFGQVPPIEEMTIQQMSDTETLILSILDEVDESEYVEHAFVYGAELIERLGPEFHKRFGRFIPGSEILRHQEGLHHVVAEAVKVKGDEGLADEVNRIGVKLTGMAPRSAILRGSLKLYNIMKSMQDYKLQKVRESMKATANVEDGGL